MPAINEVPQLNYQLYGDKRNVPVFAFHGFGQHPAVFANLAEKGYLVYAFHLFGHNSSHPGSFTEGIPPRQAAETIEAIRKTHGLEQVWVMGFSMGGRLALTYALHYPKHVQQLVLLAPDGLYQHFWYTWATGSQAGKALFRAVLFTYPLVRSLFWVGAKLRLVDKSFVRLADSQLSTRNHRSRLFRAWPIFKKLWYNQAEAGTQLADYGVDTTLVTGTRDVLFAQNRYAAFIEAYKNLNCILLPCGHNKLVKFYIEALD